MLATEAAVMLLVFALYLQDSLLLLYDNEAVFEARGKGLYRAHLGLRAFHLGGRNPLLPNPLTPWRPMFRVSWDASPSALEPAPVQHNAIERAARGGSIAGWGLIPLGVLLFAGLPLCLYFNVGWAPFLTLVGVMYSCAIAILWSLWRKRSELALDRKRFALLCFESLICLPCALNLVRKSSLRVPLRGDLLQLAQPLLSPHDWRVLVEQILKRVDEKIEAEEQGGASWQTLTQYRTRLAGLIA